MAIRFFDMFAGIGGFRSELEAVGGFKCVGHCEIDKYANQAYNAMYNTEGEVFYADAEPSTPARGRISTLFAADFPARVFQSLENGWDLLTVQEGLCFLKLPVLPPLKDLHFCCLKMFPGSCRMTAAGRLTRSSVRWMTWGTMSRGRCLTARILESPSPTGGCILSDILETDVPERYFLSQTQMGRFLSKSCLDQRDGGYTPLLEYPSP